MLRRQQIMFIVFIDFTLNVHPERGLKVNEIVEMAMSIYSEGRLVHTFVTFVRPTVYRNVYLEDIIWDDLKEQKSLEEVLAEQQRQGVSNYDITLVLFESPQKMAAFFKETELKGIALLWRWFFSFDNLIPPASLNKYLTNAAQPLFKLNQYFHSAKEDTPNNNVRLMSEKLFDGTVPLKRVKAHAFESQIFIEDKPLFQEFNLALLNCPPQQPQPARFDQILPKDINAQPRKAKNAHDYEYLAIFDASSPKEDNWPILIHFGVVIYDLESRQVVKNCILFQYIDAMLDDHDLELKTFDFLNKDLYRKEKVPKAEAFRVLQDFLAPFANVALLMQYSHAYSTLLPPAYDFDLFGYMFILKIEVYQLIGNLKGTMNLDHIAHLFNLPQRDTLYDALQNCLIMSEVVTTLLHRGWKCKRQNIKKLLRAS